MLKIKLQNQYIVTSILVKMKEILSCLLNIMNGSKLTK
jgi:hypothetical protein